ncbi:unnamed protein product [Arctogadus glacialis]
MLRSRPTSHPRVPEPPETTLSPPRSDGVPDSVVSSTQAAPALSSCCSRFPSPSLLHCNGENWGRSWPEERTIGVVSSSGTRPTEAGQLQEDRAADPGVGPFDGEEVLVIDG